jgi:hypothetical protein
VAISRLVSRRPRSPRPAGYPDPSELGRMMAEHGIWTAGGNDPRDA